MNITRHGTRGASQEQLDSKTADFMGQVSDEQYRSELEK